MIYRNYFENLFYLLRDSLNLHATFTMVRFRCCQGIVYTGEDTYPSATVTNNAVLEHFKYSKLAYKCLPTRIKER